MINEKKKKQLFISIIVLLSVVVALGIFATIMMYMDRYGVESSYKYDYYYNYYLGKYVAKPSISYYSHGESGIMPNIGVLCAIAAIVLFIIGNRTNKKLFAFGIAPAGVASLLFALSCLVACFTQYNYYAYDPLLGYYIGALPAAGLLIISIVLAIVLLKLNKNENPIGITANQSVMVSTAASMSNNTVASSIDKYETLKQYKKLLDAGAITQEEFDQLKKSVLSN